MSLDDRDDLRTRLQRNAPDVDVNAGWTALQSRIGVHARRKVGRTRRILVACAAICLIPAAVFGALLAVAGLGNRHSVVRLGEGPTEQTVFVPSTTATTDFEVTAKVEAESLTDAWVRAGEMLGFDAKTVYPDQLELDYSLGAELRRVYIHGYTELAEVTVRSAVTSPAIELIVTLRRSGADPGRDIAAQPVLTVLDALESTGGVEAMFSRPEVKEMMVPMMKRLAGAAVADPVCRVTAPWDLSGRDEIPSPAFMYVGKLGQDVRAGGDRLFEPLSAKDIGLLEAARFVQLALTVRLEDDTPADEPSNAKAYPSRIYFLLPAGIHTGDEGSASGMPSEATVEVPLAVETSQPDISP